MNVSRMRTKRILFIRPHGGDARETLDVLAAVWHAAGLTAGSRDSSVGPITETDWMHEYKAGGEGKI